MAEYHTPVMLDECLEGLNINPDGIYVDVTFGGGGHSRAILARLSEKGKLVAFDQDEDALQNIPADKRFIFIDQNFEFLKNHLRYQELLPVDGVLADLGVSSYQFDTGERGFSFRFDDAELDMRMNRSGELTAASVLNHYSEEQLAAVFFHYGELRNSRSIAKQVITYRNNQPIITVSDLKKAISRSTPKFQENKFLARVFQALRIEVNHELDVLKKFLLQCTDILKTEGRLVVMCYHSLEDRLVKNFINSGDFEGEQVKDLYGHLKRPFEPVIKRAVIAGEEEREMNNRSRSAKLRVAKKNLNK